MSSGGGFDMSDVTRRGAIRLVAAGAVCLTGQAFAADEKAEKLPGQLKRLYNGSKVPEGKLFGAATEQRRAAIRDKGERILVTEAEALRADKGREVAPSKESTLEVQKTEEFKPTAKTDVINAGPRYAGFPWYSIGDQRLKCVVKAISGAYDYNSINDAAKALILQSYQGNWNSHIWDDAWLWYSLPDNQEKYFLFAWYNWDFSPTQYQYGWMAVRNRPAYWEVRANDGSYVQPGNDSQVKKTYTTNGYRVDLDFYNPDNEGDWTPNDFWYGFGY
jgi:hypothetical protein